MVKHTQTILLQKQMNCLSVFEHFIGLAYKKRLKLGLNSCKGLLETSNLVRN